MFASIRFDVGDAARDERDVSANVSYARRYVIVDRALSHAIVPMISLIMPQQRFLLALLRQEKASFPRHAAFCLQARLRAQLMARYESFTRAARLPRRVTLQKV